MPSTDYSNNYLLYNSQTTKNLVIAVKIDGLDTILSSSDLFKRIRYGDPGLVYGQPGVVYGGLTPYDDFKSILDLTQSNLTIQQKIEPEQGRSSVSLLTLNFVDLNGYMTELISPGILLDDIMGKQIRVYLGFQEIAFPEDYTLIFRGRISNVSSTAGNVEIQISDPNVVRRQQIFFSAITTLDTDITDTDTTIPVAAVSDFHQQVLGPDGNYDPAVGTYIKIEDEWIEYPPTGIDTINEQFVGVTRGARGTTAVAHMATSEVDSGLELRDEAISMALKIMLSGWQGPYIENVTLQGAVITNDPITGNQPQGLVLPVGVDAIIEYGIAVGDYITVAGFTNAGNNGQCRVVTFLSTEESNNQVIVTDKTFTPEVTTATISVRSQYDTYPDSCGLQMPSFEVDIDRHQFIQNTFLGSDENAYRFFITESQDSGKTFLESEIYLPVGCYSLTRFGRMSMQLTHAPLADQRLQILDGSNITNPQNITVTRGVNSRKFFNQIQWQMDFDDEGNATKIINAIDTTSLNIIGLASLLPLSGTGLRSDITTEPTIDRRTNYLLSRYKNGALILSCTTNFEVGALIEAGDVIAVKDDGVLKISNLMTGIRNLGAQLFEVIDRSLDLFTGQVSLQLVAGLGADITDRYATFSPSTILRAGTDQTHLVLGDSYGTATPGQEYLKWANYLGLRGLVHNEDYSIAATCNMDTFSPTDPNTLIVSGLSFVPTAGMQLDVDNYPTNTDPYDQELIKIVHCFWDPQESVVSGLSTTQFTVPPSAIDVFQLNLPVLVHNTDYTRISVEQLVTSIDTGTNTITVAGSLGLTPQAGDFVDLIGFADLGGPYRWIG